MDILPAIDLRGGNVVRLAQGDYDRQTVYSDSPMVVAASLASAGCQWIHVVDLDAAKSGNPSNFHAVAEIAAGVDVSIELGGAMRSTQAIRRVLAGGVHRVIVGSAAVEDWPWFEGLLGHDELAGRIVLGLDARDGKLATHGWTEQVDLTAVEVARRVTGSSLAAIVYTDIARDGMMTGPNFAATAELIETADVGVIASGGIASMDDVIQCHRIGCAGAVIGRAYYEGKIDLAEALAAVG